MIFLFIFLAGFFLFRIYTKDQTEKLKNKFKNEIIPQAVRKVLGENQTKITVGEVKETNGVIQFDLTLKYSDGNEQKYVSYITKDGKILFPSGTRLDNVSAGQNTSQPQRKKLTCSDVSKSDKPILTAYVMTNCPFGLQMQRVFKNVINTDKEAKNNLRVEYIFNQSSNFETGELDSLHGKEEAQENLRQICLREEQPELYWQYVACYMQKQNNSENCLVKTGIDKSSLEGCMTDKSRGLKYAKEDFDKTKKLNISGSPTLVLNENQIIFENDFGGRNPNAIKEILCCSSDKKLAYCNKEFSKNNATVSFSEKDEETSGSSTSSGCGN